MELQATYSRKRFLALFSFALAVAFAFPLLQPGLTTVAVHAQEEGEGGAPAAAAGATQGETGGRNMFLHIIYSVGWFFGFILLALSVGLVALLVLLFMDLRMSVAVPPGFIEDFTETVNKRRFKEAFDMARNDNSFLGRVLTAGMGRLQYGIEDAREAALNMVESIKASKQQLVTYVATVGTVGPMIGLITTVYGMIRAFMVLETSGAQPQVDKLAAAISSALVGTLLGIGIAIIAIFFHGIFLNRVVRLAQDVSNISDDLLTQMYHNSKKPAAPTPAGAPSANAQGTAVTAQRP
ncbi:MAG: MotA/TolQ/ExbB proton channel family protein [Gemmataceae bacterium]